MNSAVLPIAAVLASSARLSRSISSAVAHCAACQATPDFEKQPRLFHMGLALAARRRALDETGKLIGEKFGIGRRHLRAGAAGDFDEALLLQEEQGLAHRRTADAIALRQFLFGRQLGPDLELARSDRPLDEFGDLMRALASADLNALYVHLCHSSTRALRAKTKNSGRKCKLSIA